MLYINIVCYMVGGWNNWQNYWLFYGKWTKRSRDERE